ncbi:MAG TPA: CBS domain-containing protein [Anaerolineae bacterium]|nr:CBS domain-containing protein [Anaerolineae bacterium]
MAAYTPPACRQRGGTIAQSSWTYERSQGAGVRPTSFLRDDMEQDPSRKEQIITDQAAGLITRVEELAYELRIKEVMVHEVKVVSSDTPIVEVLELFRQTHISGAPVISNDKLIGIISIEDLIRCLREGNLQATVADYMSSHVITVNSFDPVVEALKVFAHTRVGRLPVINEAGKLVGIITKGDITRGVLGALQQDYQAEEVKRYRASHLFEDIVSNRTSLILRYQIEPRDFTHGGTASSYIKRALLRLGANPQIARRSGIAIYEAEMNLIIHTTHGGAIRVEIEPNLILMEAVDDGPGIENIELAMKAGYSTASEEVRELGFGAGMGLKNIERCVDEMVLESTLGQGTKLTMKIRLQPEETFRETKHSNSFGDPVEEGMR